MRAVLLLAVSLALPSCELFDGTARPAPGDVLSDGRLVVGVGEVSGQNWIATMERNRDELCHRLFVDGQEMAGVCGLFADREETGFGGGTGGRLTFFYAIVPNTVRQAEVETSIGTMTTTPVPLDALGGDGGFAVIALPAGAAVRLMVTLDAEGNELERLDVLEHLDVGAWPRSSRAGHRAAGGLAGGSLRRVRTARHGSAAG